jgi:hypothetical protein
MRLLYCHIRRCHFILRAGSCFLMVLFLLPVAAFCQQTVHGTIKDNEGKALPGITVSLKSKKNATKTDSSGHFRLAAATGDVLVVSAVNYEELEMKVDGRSEYTIVLKTKVTEMDDVIVIGYGTTTKGDATGAVS